MCDVVICIFHFLEDHVDAIQHGIKGFCQIFDFKTSVFKGDAVDVIALSFYLFSVVR